MYRFKLISVFVSLVLLLTSCKDEEVAPLDIPATYEFTRGGASSVEYADATAATEKLIELRNFIRVANTGTAFSGSEALALFTTAATEYSLSDLVSDSDSTSFAQLISEMATNSGQTDSAFEGNPGLLTRANGTTVIVDANGLEYVQIIEKGLMAAALFRQIVGVVLPNIGSFDNSAVVAGQNYTAQEHAWDLAFGLFYAPADFKSAWPTDRNGELRFWSTYSNTTDAFTGFNNDIMEAFRGGRAAITAGHSSRNTYVQSLNALFQKVAAATVIHYINDGLETTSGGERHHVLSEAYAFLSALAYSPSMEIGELQYDAMMTDLSNLYTITVSDLQNIKNTLSSAYGFDSVKDQL